MILGYQALAKLARRRRSQFDSEDDARKTFKSKLPFATFHPDCLQNYIGSGLTQHSGKAWLFVCRFCMHAPPKHSVLLCFYPMVGDKVLLLLKYVLSKAPTMVLNTYFTYVSQIAMSSHIDAPVPNLLLTCCKSSMCRLKTFVH